MIATAASKLLARWLLGCALAMTGILYLAPTLVGEDGIDVAIQVAASVAVAAILACWLDREKYPAVVPSLAAAVAVLVIAPAALVPAMLVFGLVVAMAFTVPLSLPASWPNVRSQSVGA